MSTNLAHARRANRILGVLLVVALCALVSFLVAWGARIHTTHDLNVELCHQQQRQNTALLLVIDARLIDPTTPAAVKATFRTVIHEYLEPQNCDNLP